MGKRMNKTIECAPNHIAEFIIQNPIPQTPYAWGMGFVKWR